MSDRGRWFGGSVEVATSQVSISLHLVTSGAPAIQLHFGRRFACAKRERQTALAV